MRTTLNLDDDLLPEIKTCAVNRSIPLGKAVSLPVRRGLSIRCPTHRMNGLVVFDPPGETPPVRTAHVRRLEEEEDAL
jgi:hypothetical protein